MSPLRVAELRRAHEAGLERWDLPADEARWARLLDAEADR